MEEQEEERNKYEGLFNWYGQVFKLYTWAYSKDQAFNFLCEQLSEIVGTRLFNVRHYFYDSNKYEIKEIRKEGQTCASGR